MQPTLERRAIRRDAAEIRAEGDDARRFVGYAAVFNSDSEDLGGFVERIAPGAFAEAIRRDDVRALVDHVPSLILGRNRAGSLRLAEDARGLVAEIDMPDTQLGRDTQYLVKNGIVDGMSFAFSVDSDEWQKRADGSIIRTLLKLRLYDVSIVTYPAYPDTSVAVRSLAKFKAPAAPSRRLDLARWLDTTV